MHVYKEYGTCIFLRGRDKSMWVCFPVVDFFLFELACLSLGERVNFYIVLGLRCWDLDLTESKLLSSLSILRYSVSTYLLSSMCL